MIIEYIYSLEPDQELKTVIRILMS